MKPPLHSPLDRREFLARGMAGAAGLSLGMANPSHGFGQGHTPTSAPNLVFVFADQWRVQAAGYQGDPNAQTPAIDRLARESLNFTHAVSGCPVCSPYRASLLSGQYWMTHGHFLNDLQFPPEKETIGKVFSRHGYDTGYIGKWHLDGHGRSAFIPRERRHGFDYWKVLECTHDYNNSFYYSDSDEKLRWEGYDAIAQTKDAQEYIAARAGSGKPFALFLSWGPPHAPYETAPEEYRARFKPEDMVLHPNVPKEQERKAREDLAGYYAHLAVLDDCLADLLRTLEESGLEENTLFVLTSDHGDMLYSQGSTKKQQPWEESLRVPFFLRYPKRLGPEPREVPTLLNTPDIMPTLLGLCGLPIPASVEGRDFSAELLEGKAPHVESALTLCAAPFGQWTRARGGREFRGIRTERYTYCRDLNGPWLLYDNQEDPYQLANLVGHPEKASLQADLDSHLREWLLKTGDEFETAEALIARWGYAVGENLTVRYAN